MIIARHKKGDYSKSTQKKSCKSFDLQDSVAEREGFEPPAPLSAAVFKTAVIDHSTISPDELLSLAEGLVA